MTKQVLTNVRLFTGGVDLSGNSNKAEISGTAADVDVTNYRSAGWRERLGGLIEGKIAVEGFWEAGAQPVDDFLGDVSNARGPGIVGPWTIAPNDTNAYSALAYVTNALEADYKLLGKVGDAAPFTANALTSGKFARGLILHPSGTPETITGVGPATAVSAILPTTAAQALNLGLHVYSVAGTTPSLTVRVESDDNAGFTSPTTVATFTAATVAGGQFIRVAGANTDTYLRAAWTISGTTPSFLFVVSAGKA